MVAGTGVTMYGSSVFIGRIWISSIMFSSWLLVFLNDEIWGSFYERDLFDLFVSIVFSAPIGGFLTFIVLPTWIFRYLTDSPYYQDFAFNPIEVTSLMIWIPLSFLIILSMFGLVGLLPKKPKKK